MDSTWRPDNWKEIVKANVSRTGGFFNPYTPIIIETDRLLFEAAATAILQAYLDSNEFIKDASEYCQEAGWKEPD